MNEPEQKPIDFSQYADEPEAGLTAERLQTLTAQIKREAELAHEITELEAGLKDLKTEQRLLVEESIPELLADAGLDEVKLSDGTKVQVDQKIRVSTTGKWRDPINDWLEKTDQADLIRNELLLSFPVEDDAKVDDVLDTLSHANLLTDWKRNRYVNATSFAALLRARLADGEDVPLDELGAHLQKFAKIQRPKEK